MCGLCGTGQVSARVGCWGGGQACSFVGGGGVGCWALVVDTACSSSSSSSVASLARSPLLPPSCSLPLSCFVSLAAYYVPSVLHLTPAVTHASLTLSLVPQDTLDAAGGVLALPLIKNKKTVSRVMRAIIMNGDDADDRCCVCVCVCHGPISHKHHTMENAVSVFCSRLTPPVSLTHAPLLSHFPLTGQPA